MGGTKISTGEMLCEGEKTGAFGREAENRAGDGCRDSPLVKEAEEQSIALFCNGCAVQTS